MYPNKKDNTVAHKMKNRGTWRHIACDQISSDLVESIRGWDFHDDSAVDTHRLGQATMYC
jgi:hypothetical protein